MLLDDFDKHSDLFGLVQDLGTFFARLIGLQMAFTWEVQLACAGFLAAYLEADSEGDLHKPANARSGTFAPTSFLLAITSDADIRSRALGSPIAARVFDTTSLDEEQMSELYDRFRDGLPSDPSVPQHILTRALSLTNVAIINSAARRSALFHLLEIVLATDMLPNACRIYLQMQRKDSASRPFQLLPGFCGQITWGIGHQQLRSAASAMESSRLCEQARMPRRDFRCERQLCFLPPDDDGRTQFDAIVQLTKRTQQQGLQECLPFLTAAYLGFAVHAAQQQGSLDLPESLDRRCNSCPCWVSTRAAITLCCGTWSHALMISSWCLCSHCTLSRQVPYQKADGSPSQL